jgi:acetolactate synthase small subunit
METFELTLNNEPGALAHVVALVTGRRWKLGSLQFPAASSVDRRQLTLALDSGGRGHQVEAQLAKLYDVLAVKRLPAE